MRNIVFIVLMAGIPLSISSYYNRKEKAAIQKQQNEKRLAQQIAREERHYQEGYQKGYQKGYQEGMDRGRKEAERKFQQTKSRRK